MARSPRPPLDWPPPDGTVVTLMRTDGRARIRVLRRPDGLFALFPEMILYDEDEDVSYWAGGGAPYRSGLFADLEVAEREARSIPGFADAIRC